MKVYVGTEVKLHRFLTSVLDSLFSCKEPIVPIEWETGGGGQTPETI